MEKLVVLVDEADNATGFLDVDRAHDGQGVRHRAFMVLILNQSGEVLLCKRSLQKRLWPGYWENSCSSHPAPGESQEVAAQRRLHEELGFSVPLEQVGVFEYHVLDGDAGAEHEVCAVLTGVYDGELVLAPEETDECRWVDLNSLLSRQPAGDEAPWLRPGLDILSQHLAKRGAAKETAPPDADSA